MSLSRRELLRLAALLGIAPLALGNAGCDDGSGDPADDNDGGVTPDGGEGSDAAGDSFVDDLPVYEYDGELGPEMLFEHGVASGDPLADALVIWTRASVETDSQEVWWEIAVDPDFTQRVQVGTADAVSQSDWTVKVDVQGLEAGTTYYYRFKCLGRTSPIGRGKTAPSGSVDHVRFALVSCSSAAHGYFHVYKALSEQSDFDAILHLGDYIYEYANGEYGNVRALDPEHEIITLDDYRRRYRWYRKDADLQAAHRQHAFINVWDDHEIANNGWRDGAGNHDPDEGAYADRKAAGQQAFFEWLPIRENGDRTKIWRQLQYGNLVDLMLLDTRYFGRDEQSTPDRLDPDRSLLGEEQAQWLDESLASSTATWRILGQQVMCGQLLLNGNPINNDQWDGYEASRRRLFSTLRDSPVDNVVVLTGDIHSSWAMELTEDPTDPELYNPETGEGSVAVEFVVPAVSSPGLDLPGGNSPAILDLMRQFNPHIKYFDTAHRGYVCLDIRPEGVQSDWFHFDDIVEAEADPEQFAAGYYVASGETTLQAMDSPAEGGEGDPFAP